MSGGVRSAFKDTSVLCDVRICVCKWGCERESRHGSAHVHSVAVCPAHTGPASEDGGADLGGRGSSGGGFQMQREHLWAQPQILNFAIPGPAGCNSGQGKAGE